MGQRCEESRPSIASGLPTPLRASLREPTMRWAGLTPMLLTVAKLPEYLRAAARLLAEVDRRAIIDPLAAHPADGDLIEGTGGVRKLRWGRDGRGKRGGVQLIHCFHSETKPPCLLTMFAKSERANLSKAERNELAGLVHLLLRIWLEWWPVGQGIREHQARPDRGHRPRQGHPGRREGGAPGGRGRGRRAWPAGLHAGTVRGTLRRVGGRPEALGAWRSQPARAGTGLLNLIDPDPAGVLGALS